MLGMLHTFSGFILSQGVGSMGLSISIVPGVKISCMVLLAA